MQRGRHQNKHKKQRMMSIVMDTKEIRSRKKRKNISMFLLPLILCSFVLLSFFASCQSYKLKQKLSPEDAEFLSQVRYIITKQEEKIYLELTEEERKNFKKEFWRRRDPDPETPENELKMEYFNRMERANELFRGEGRPGWLTDRGRILILFGSPTDRIENPRGYDTYGRCEELWYYGRFPVMFIDRYCMGVFRLITYDLTSISSLNLKYMSELSRAQERAQQTLMGEKGYFDFDWEIKKALVNKDKTEGIILIHVPYAKLWYKEAEKGILETTLTVRLKVMNADDMVIWEHEESFRVEIEEERLEKDKGETFEISIPFTIDKQLEKNRAFALVMNRTGGDRLEKVLEF